MQVSHPTSSEPGLCVRGRVWLLGDDIDTDALAPFGTLTSDKDAIRAAMLPGDRAIVDHIKPGDIIFAGRNFGCGSSREQAVSNLQAIGVGAVVAISFARIFFRNGFASGLPLLQADWAPNDIRQGNEVEIDVGTGRISVTGRDMVVQAAVPTPEMLGMLKDGGVMARLGRQVKVGGPTRRYPTAPEDSLPTRQMTMAERILARASGRSQVAPGEILDCAIDRVVLHEPLVLCMRMLKRLGLEEVWDAERVAVVLCQFFPAPTPFAANAHKMARDLVEALGISRFYGHEGIINQVMIERGQAIPGRLMVGSDSHSTSYGALAAAGAGLGFTELASILATGAIWMRVPPTLRFDLEGAMGKGVMSKDLILHLAGLHGADGAQYKALEFGGSGLESLSIASRITVANMGVELGAKFALFEADHHTLKYLEGRADGPIAAFGPDVGARYERRDRLNLSELEPMVACPNSPDNVKPAQQLYDTKVDQVFLGSCTNARLEDLEAAASILRGRRVDPRVRLVVTPASKAIYGAALANGLIETLSAAGAYITTAGCGACPGGHGGVVGSGEVCVSTTDRNFQGRMGDPDALVYLASPLTAAAAAVAGRIIDPREILDH